MVRHVARWYAVDREGIHEWPKTGSKEPMAGIAILIGRLLPQTERYKAIQYQRFT